ncbi:tRNA uridine 5-carboxymethylaminomethyl modification enzyme MnmG [subsurface metagenome]
MHNVDAFLSQFSTKVNIMSRYAVIVIGAGHAGCEAALATARMGLKTLLLTINLDTIAQMSCNPAIGGLAKGQLVREIDALGGEMAKVIDQTSIHFRMLNRSKGPAVQSPRAQADKKAYQATMKKVIESQPNLFLKQEMVEEILTENSRAVGVRCASGIVYHGESVILTTGTFMKGLIHIGSQKFRGGRIEEPSADNISDSLRRLGFQVGRLKTGTSPRLNKHTIDYTPLTPQPSDNLPQPFSYSTKHINSPQVNCYITYTNPHTHELIHANLDRAPLYTGQIQSTGPRYCPSIETKIVRFSDKMQHQIFLEPEGLSTDVIYANGIATSLPKDVQETMVHSIKGLEKAEIIRYGYAIEYDYVLPTQLKPSLETKLIENLFHAGQINGTSGYEEAAAQGLMAGINAALKIRGKAPLILSRAEAYIGVMIDDLVTQGVKEPYRMFTSRAEYRLLLRQDNADRRLMKYGHQVGLIPDDQMEQLEHKEQLTDEIYSALSIQ